MTEQDIVKIARVAIEAEGRRARKMALAAEEFDARADADAAMELLFTTKQAEASFSNCIAAAMTRQIETSTGLTISELAELGEEGISRVLRVQPEEANPDTTAVGDPDIPGIDIDGVAGDGDA